MEKVQRIGGENAINNLLTSAQVVQQSRCMRRCMLGYGETHRSADKKLYDNKPQWRDISNDVIELNSMCNTILRPDQIAFIFGHTMMAADQSGEEKKVLSVIGKKLTRVQPEGFYPMVLISRIDWGMDGDNTYLFQTKANKSSAKSPIGMFDDFEVPNSLALVDATIRKYYGLPENKYGK